jgi:hypothetical protein
LGPRAQHFLSDTETINLLSDVFGQQFELSSDRSCVTLYRAGDYLGPHVDEPASECAVTLIVYLDVIGVGAESGATGLELRIYGPERPLSLEATLTIPTECGAVVIGAGSKFWHERPVLEKGEQIDALTACYRVSDGTDGSQLNQASHEGERGDSLVNR